jgi:hypothetical protein
MSGSPVIATAGAFLPATVQPWIVAFARTPGLFMAGVLLLALLLNRSAGLQTTIRDGMRGLWMTSLGMPGHVPPLTPARQWVRVLRQNRYYQRGFQSLKWRVLPDVFGVTMLTLAVGLGLSVLSVGAIRGGMWIAERSDAECDVASSKPPFRTSSPCWDLGEPVQAGRRYRVDLTVDPRIPWRDRTIDASPSGFGASEMSLVGNLLTPLRRSVSARWFQPMAKIQESRGSFATVALDMQQTATDHSRYVAQFTAPRSGRLFMFVNDVLLPPWLPFARCFYGNNHGEVTQVDIQPVDAGLVADRCEGEPASTAMR